MEDFAEEKFLWLKDLLYKLEESESSELVVRGSEALFLLTKAQTYHIEPSPFKKSAQFLTAVQTFSFTQGQRLDPLSPAACGILSKRNVRWHCTIPPICPDGPILILRKHIDLRKILPQFHCKEKIWERLIFLFKDKKPMLFCGTTGCGKTTLLSYLLYLYCQDERIIFLEDTPELLPHSPLWLSLCCQKAKKEDQGGITMDFIFAESLKMRPDRIVIGEIRRKEMAVFRQAIYSAHQGCLATVHADNAQEVKARFIADVISAEMAKTVYCVEMERDNISTIRNISELTF